MFCRAIFRVPIGRWLRKLHELHGAITTMQMFLRFCPGQWLRFYPPQSHLLRSMKFTLLDLLALVAPCLVVHAALITEDAQKTVTQLLFIVVSEQAVDKITRLPQ